MRKLKKTASVILALALAFSVIPYQASVAAEGDPLSVTVDWNADKGNDMQGIGAAWAFNKSHNMMQVAEFAPDTIRHLLDLLWDSENGTGQTAVRTIIGDGGVRSNSTEARPGYNPINGLRADPTKPGYDVEGNKIPTNGTTGQYGYTLNDWGNRHYDGASDTIWPNEGQYDADGKLVSGYGFVWDLPQWNQPVPGDTGGFTNDFVGKGEIKVVDRPRTMKEIFDVDQVWIMRQAMSYGVDTFYACAWSAPYWMKTSMSIFGNDGSATTDCIRNDVVDGKKPYFQAYADYLAALVYGYWTEFGAKITHVGPYNESEAGHGYSGMRVRNAAELAEQVNDYILPTFARMFGEDGPYAGALSPDGKPLDWIPEIVIGDATALNQSFLNTNYTGPYFKNIDNYGKVTASTHFYGNVTYNGNGRTFGNNPGTNPLAVTADSGNYPAALRNYPIWQTESANGDGVTYPGGYGVRWYYQSIDDAIKWSYMITNCFNSDPGFNAFMHWWNIGNNGTPASDLIRWQTTGSPQAAGGSTNTGAYHVYKRFYAFGHMSRFARNGDIHIGSTTQLASYLNSLAYKRPDGSDFSVTLTNADYAAKTVTVTLNNFDGYKGDLTGVTVFRTTDSENMKKVGVIPVTDGTITVEMPAQSIITLVPSDGTYATYNGLDGERDLYSTYEAAGSDGVIGTPAKTAGQFGYDAVTMQNGDALVYKNVNFADGSANGAIARRHLLYILANIESAPTGGIIRAYVAEPGTVITNLPLQATFVGEILVPKGTDSPRRSGTSSSQTTGTRSTRIDTGDLGAYMCKDLYLVAYGMAGTDLFTVSRFRFDADDNTTATNYLPTAGNINNSTMRPVAVGVLANGDFEDASRNGDVDSRSTANWSVAGTGTLSATDAQTYSGLSNSMNSYKAYSAMLSGRAAGSGVQQNLTGKVTVGEKYTFRGMFMPTSDDATAKAELVYMNGSEEIGRETIAERSGLDLLPERESGARPKDTSYGGTAINVPIAGIPMNMTAVNPTKFRPSGWYEVTGSFFYNPPVGTTAVWLVLSDDKASDLYLDEITLVPAPDRMILIQALNLFGPYVNSAPVSEVLAAITDPNLTQATVISLGTRLIPMFTLGTTTIVSGLSAWISVSTNITEGTACLHLEDGSKLYSTPVKDGVARIFIEKAPAPGEYGIYVFNDNAGFGIERYVTVVPYNKDIWKPVISANGDGKAVIVFADAIAPASAGYAATLNGEPVAVTQEGNTLVTDVDYADLKTGDKFVVSGVKYPVLFPSYSFTFTVAAK